MQVKNIQSKTEIQDFIKLTLGNFIFYESYLAQSKK